MGNGRVSLVTALVFVLATVVLASETVQNRAVIKRMQTMQQAAASVELLNGMMTGRVLYDRERAAQARRNVIRATGNIPKLFRRSRTDPLSFASPAIWTNWEDFENRARSARAAARDIRFNSSARLAETLPAVIHTCLACHTTYRMRTNQLGRSRDNDKIRLN